MEEPRRGWYVILTKTSFENKVKANLESKIQTQGLTDKIFAVEIPMMQEKVDDGNGNKILKLRKRFPGYVIVDMIVDEKTWYIVRNTDGVTGFASADSTRPFPLSDEEVKSLNLGGSADVEAQAEKEARDKAKAEFMTDLVIGQSVRINSGGFENFPAVVNEIDCERGKIKVVVEMFGGRETIVDLDFNQVEKID